MERDLGHALFFWCQFGTNCQRAPKTSSIDFRARKRGDPMAKKRQDPEDAVPGWYCDTADGDYELGLDKSKKHSGSQSAYIKSIVSKPAKEHFGNLCQWIAAEEYRGKHLQMTAWVKTKLEGGAAHLWVQVDGEGHGNIKRDCFDNMDDRPIKGVTDWRQYSVVVDVPQTSTWICFGCILVGTGKIWCDDVSIKSVSRKVPLTGQYTTARSSNEETKKTSPRNLNFEKG